MRTKRETGRDSIAEFICQWSNERPDLDPSPLGILGRVQRISVQLQKRASEEWLGPLGLTWESFSLLMALRRCGAPFRLRPTDIYRESLLTSGAITNRIDRAETQAGYVGFQIHKIAGVHWSNGRPLVVPWPTAPSRSTSRSSSKSLVRSARPRVIRLHLCCQN